MTIEALPTEVLVNILKYLSSYDHCFSVLNVCKRFRKIIVEHIIFKEIKFFKSDVTNEVRERGLNIEDPPLISTKEALMKLPNLKVYHDYYIFTHIVHLLSNYCQNLEAVAVRNLGYSLQETEIFLRNCGALQKLGVCNGLSNKQLTLITRACARTLHHLCICVDPLDIILENIPLPETLITLELTVGEDLNVYLENVDESRKPQTGKLMNLRNLRIIEENEAYVGLRSLLEYIIGNMSMLEVLSLTWDNFERIDFCSIDKLRMLQLIPLCNAKLDTDALYFIKKNTHLECIHLDYRRFNHNCIHNYLSNIKKPLDILFRRGRLTDDEMLMRFTNYNPDLVITDACESGHRKIKEGSVTFTKDHCNFVIKKFSDTFSI